MEKETKNTFKERVKNVTISCAEIYKKEFVEYDYLICSEAFEEEKYQVIKAEKSNFLHLIGVNTTMSPEAFFEKCINGTLEENDFDFKKKDQSEDSVRGTVRQKIIALPKMLKMFDKALFAEKNFTKNKIYCAFATADADFTIGFVKSGRPKTLMRKNKLDKKKRKPVDLVMRKKRNETTYSKIIFGTKQEVEKYSESIKHLIRLEEI